MTRKSQDTDTTTTAQSRFVVSLPKDIGAQLDTLADKMRGDMQGQFGFAPDLTRAQVVTALVRGALASRESNGTPDGHAAPETAAQSAPDAA